ncbi:MAG: phosphatidylserine/phosphatidylglycerophosphate/cardiolipin synthase-like enzyme, partial [Alteromonas naphthalenivorans]
RFFTPDDSYALQKIMVGLIEMEKTHIRTLMFRLTNQPITDALVRAKKRGVKIEVVIDSGASSLLHYSKVHILASNGIPLNVYQPISMRVKDKGYQSLMHQKTIIFANTFGGQVVTTGSLNYTYAAFHGNEEAVIIRNDRQVFKDHEKNFSRVKNRSYCYEIYRSKLMNLIIQPEFLHKLYAYFIYTKK